MFLAAFERSGRCRDLSFSKRRDFFSEHSLGFGFGSYDKIAYAWPAS
jgi:hypothetical protein